MHSLQLIRFKELSVAELAPQLYEVASTSKHELQRRYSPGTIRRLGSSLMIATETTERAVIADDKNNLAKNGKATFAVATTPETTGGNSKIVGVGTIIAGLSMYIQHLPLKPKYTDKIGYHGVRTEALYGNANVSEWTTGAYQADLHEVYEGLINQVNQPYTVWTIEPVAASSFVHAAIQAAGMVPIGTPERYDIGEDRSMRIPKSQAYGTHVL